MDRSTALARLNRRVLEAYSHHTTQRLRASLPLPLALPWLDRLLALNVDKEARKDALVIARAAEAVAAGHAPDVPMAKALLEASKAIDRQFLGQAGGAPLDILIHYDAVGPVRGARIQLLLATAYRVLSAWQDRRDLRRILMDTLPAPELENTLLELLILYARETQVLGEAVRMPFLLAPLRQRVVGGLYTTMETAARGLAREVASGLSGR
jgi:hypothetical protein